MSFYSFGPLSFDEWCTRLKQVLWLHGCTGMVDPYMMHRRFMAGLTPESAARAILTERAQGRAA